tara:strand:+ start:11335 stop:11466 length:132 start_codon:yes stop_codon:yes gene_type:complete
MIKLNLLDRNKLMFAEEGQANDGDFDLAIKRFIVIYDRNINSY